MSTGTEKTPTARCFVCGQAEQPFKLGTQMATWYTQLDFDFYIVLSLFALCLCYVRMPQLVLPHVYGDSISCLNITYLLPVFAQSISDLRCEQSSVR